MRHGAIPKKHEFEGQLLTVKEIQQLVPVLTKDTVNNYLKKGMNTKQAMLCYNPRAVQAKAAIKATLIRKLKSTKENHMSGYVFKELLVVVTVLTALTIAVLHWC